MPSQTIPSTYQHLFFLFFFLFFFINKRLRNQTPCYTKYDWGKMMATSVSASAHYQVLWYIVIVSAVLYIFGNWCHIQCSDSLWMAGSLNVSAFLYYSTFLCVWHTRPSGFCLSTLALPVLCHSQKAGGSQSGKTTPCIHFKCSFSKSSLLFLNSLYYSMYMVTTDHPCSRIEHLSNCSNSHLACVDVSSTRYINSTRSTSSRKKPLC